MVYESDHRHADLLVEELELKKGQVVVTHSVLESRKVRKKDEKNADEKDAGGGSRPDAGAGQTGAGMGKARDEKDFETKQQFGQNIEKHGAGEESLGRYRANRCEPRGVDCERQAQQEHARAKTRTEER